MSKLIVNGEPLEPLEDKIHIFAPPCNILYV